MCCNYRAMRFFQLSLFAVIFMVGTSAIAQTQKPIDDPRVVIEAVELEGSLLPKAAQEQLVNSLKEREWEEGSEWVADLEHIVVRAEQEGWPDRDNQGYFGFSVGAWWKPVWREPGLHRHLHMKQAVAGVYKERGFIDCNIYQSLAVNDENQTVALVLEISQGQRYYWGNIRVIGLSPELETILRARLAKDSVVYPKLIEDFYQQYKSLLPVGASPETVEGRRNEPLAILDLTFDFRTPPSEAVHN
jgi:hypothetical protein